MELTLSPPKGPIAAKYARFVLDGEPDDSLFPGYQSLGKHNILIMAGSFGTGKSSAMSDKIIFRSILYPGSQIGLFRARLQDLKRSTWKTLEGRLQNAGLIGNVHYYLNKQDWILTIYSGDQPSTVFMFGLDTGDPISKLKSMEFDLIAIDEVNEIDEQVFDVALARLRHKVKHQRLGAEAFTQLVAVTNRDAGRNSWVYSRFFANAEQDGDYYERRFSWTSPDGRTFEASSLAIDTFTHENHSLSESVMSAAAAMSGDIRQIFMGNDWAEQGGLVFPEFNPSIHVVPPFEIPREWPMYVGIDHGLLHPTVAIFIARDPSTGLVYVVDEYYGSNESRNITASDHARTILMLARKYPNQMEWYGDPSMARREGYGYSVMDIYHENGIPINPSYRTSSSLEEDDGIVLLREWMRPYVRPAYGNVPTFRIFASVSNLIRNLRSLTWEDLAAKRNDDPFKALRYAVVMMGDSATVSNASFRMPSPLGAFRA